MVREKMEMSLDSCEEYWGNNYNKNKTFRSKEKIY